MRNFICMLLCGFGAVFLSTSDAFINKSASAIMGSTGDSAFSHQLVAIGVVIGLLALGSIASITKDRATQCGLWLTVLVAGLFSASLTIQAVSIDYASNDGSGRIEHNRQNGNEKKIERWESEIKMLNKKMKECERDNYFVPCSITERRLATLSNKIEDALDDTVDSQRAEQIDITDAVEAKSGLPGYVIERVGIYARAFAVPVMMSALMAGFWMFWGRLVGDAPLKRRAAA